MAISYWDPFREVVSLQSRLNTILQEQGRSQASEPDVTAASFVPAVDVYEDEHKLVLSIEVPGIKQEDLDVQVEKDTLTVRGERKFERDQKQQNFHRIERRYGTFYRSFSLPATVESETVQASYDAGVLRLELGKKVEAKPRQIKVNITSGHAKAADAMPTRADAQASSPVEARELTNA